MGFFPAYSLKRGAVTRWLYHGLVLQRILRSPNYSPKLIEVHDFLEQSKALEDSTCFSIFPTHENSYIVSAKQLYADIQEHLDEVE